MATTPSESHRRPLAAVVLAAGRGKRFPGVPSKVLVPLGGRALVLRVLEAVRQLAPERIVVVVGHGREAVCATVAAPDVETVDQGEPRGTGHAVRVTAPSLGGRRYDLLVLNGDVPMLRPGTLRRLVATLEANGAAAVLLSAQVADAGAYGRVVRRADGTVRAVVEAADTTPEERAIGEYNVGAYVFRAPEIFAALSGLSAGNAQGELYLTDAVRLLADAGERVDAVVLEDEAEGRGVNSQAELDALEAALLAR